MQFIDRSGCDVKILLQRIKIYYCNNLASKSLQIAICKIGSFQF